MLSAIPFTDANDLNSSAAVYPGALFTRTIFSESGSLALQATIANFGTTTKKVAILLSEANGSEKLIESVDLRPKDICITTLDKMITSADPNSSLIVRADGTPGEVLTNIQIMAASPGHFFSIPLPWKDQKQIANGGQHPWRVDGGYSSTLLLYNPHPQHANSVRLSLYANNTSWTKQISVGALSTVAVSMNDIIATNQVDDKGHALPADTSHGLVTWFTFAEPKIFGVLIQSDAVSGLLRPYACAQTYAICNVDVSDLTLMVNGDPDNAYASPVGCGTNGDCGCVESCGSGGASAALYDWSSSDSTVASLVSNPAASYGQYQGNKGGNAWSTVNVYDNMGCFTGNEGLITVQEPRASRIVTTTQNNSLSNGQYPCSSGQAGWIRVVTKIVTDQNVSDIVVSGQSLQETVTIGSPNDLNISGVQTGTATTDASGRFTDTLFVCSPLCPPSGGQTAATQTISDTYRGITYSLQSNAFTYTCNGIQINGQ